MTSMFDYDDSINLAFDAKIAGKKLVTAKHELLTKTGEFLFLAHSDRELASRMQMVEEDIEKVAHRKLANVSDSKAKLVRAIFDEWSIRHASCETCKTAFYMPPTHAAPKPQMGQASIANGMKDTDNDGDPGDKTESVPGIPDAPSLSGGTSTSADGARHAPAPTSPDAGTFFAPASDVARHQQENIGKTGPGATNGFNSADIKMPTAPSLSGGTSTSADGARHAPAPTSPDAGTFFAPASDVARHQQENIGKTGPGATNGYKPITAPAPAAPKPQMGQASIANGMKDTDNDGDPGDKTESVPGIPDASSTTRTPTKTPTSTPTKTPTSTPAPAAQNNQVDGFNAATGPANTGTATTTPPAPPAATPTTTPNGISDQSLVHLRQPDQLSVAASKIDQFRDFLNL
jgi:hypothetical protein